VKNRGCKKKKKKMKEGEGEVKKKKKKITVSLKKSLVFVNNLLHTRPFQLHLSHVECRDTGQHG